MRKWKSPNLNLGFQPQPPGAVGSTFHVLSHLILSGRYHRYYSQFKKKKSPHGPSVFSTFQSFLCIYLYIYICVFTYTYMYLLVFIYIYVGPHTPAIISSYFIFIFLYTVHMITRIYYLHFLLVSHHHQKTELLIIADFPIPRTMCGTQQALNKDLNERSIVHGTGQFCMPVFE